MLSRGELELESDARVVLVFLAGGGLEDRGNRCSGIVLEVEAMVRGLRRAVAGISRIVCPAWI